MPVLLAGLYRDLIDGIRKAESRAGGFHHMILFEPTLGWALSPLRRHSPSTGFTADRDIVFAPHVYGGAFARPGEIGAHPYRKWIRRQFAKVGRQARTYAVPAWIGEWGRPRPINEAEPHLDYHAGRQDFALVGGAWWLWKRGCGTAGPGSVIGNLFLVHCPDGAEVPSPNGARLRVISRPYPRLAPGKLTRLRGDPETAHLSLAGVVPRGARSRWLEAWFPERGDAPPQVRGIHIARVHARRVTGGWVVRAHVGGRYRLSGGY
jgi:hypothetical protein